MVNPSLLHAIVTSNVLGQIRGTNFGLSAYVCVFGDNEKGATECVHSAPGLLECSIPPAPTDIDGAAVVGTTSLHILSAVGFHSNRLTFTYFTSPTLLGLVPNFGSTDGGTRVLVTGFNFADYGGAMCSFAEVEVPADVVSMSEVACTTPAAFIANWKTGNTRVVKMYVTLNGLHYGADADGGRSQEVTFEYIDVPVVSFIAPTTGPPSLIFASKSRTGNDSEDQARYLRVHGAHFLDTADLACRFGSALLTAAMYISPSEIDCLIPPFSSATTGAEPVIAVTVNGIDFSREGAPSAAFTYVVSPELLGLSPELGPAVGGTAVTILGSGFARGVGSITETSMICRFELENRVLGEDEEDLIDGTSIWHVNAEVESDSAATCVAPAVTSVSGFTGREYATVRISLDGGSTFPTPTAPLRFLFYEDVAVTSVTPATMLASSTGDRDIIVSGQAFLRGEGLLLCSFAGPNITLRAPDDHATRGGSSIEGGEYLNTFMTMATWLSSELVQCALPDLELTSNQGALALAVRVSNNGGVDVSSSAVELVVYYPPEVVSLFPDAGPRTGGTLVNHTVDGWGLSPFDGTVEVPFSVRCLWGTTAAQSTPGVFTASANETSNLFGLRVYVACESPTAAAVAATTGNQEYGVEADEVELVIQINGQNIRMAEEGLPFKYYSEPVLRGASPSAGGELGDTEVTVSGSGFSFAAPGGAGYGKAACTFGNATVPAVVVSDSELRCRAPALYGGDGGKNISATGVSTDLRLSLNSGVDFGQSFLAFDYLPTARTTGETSWKIRY